MSEWVLKEGDLYFKQWTGIGPQSTPDLDEAARFSSEQSARQSPAYTFVLTLYEPVELGPASWPPHQRSNDECLHPR